MIPKAKKKNYVDNQAFYAALIAYRIKVNAAKAAHELLMEDWKQLCTPVLKKIRKDNPPLYAQFLEDKIEREKEGEWPRDIVVHYQLPQEPKYQAPRIPEYIGKCIWLIADGLSNYWKFNRYSYRDEMAADGIEDCILRIQSFNPEKSKNPFAYFTQICYFAAVRRIKKEKKQKDVKSAMVKNSNILDQLAHTTQTGDDAEYHNSYLTFLLENVDNASQTDEEKEEAQRTYKKTTKAHQKMLKDKELNLNTDGVIKDFVEEEPEETNTIDFGLDDE